MQAPLKQVVTTARVGIFSSSLRTYMGMPTIVTKAIGKVNKIFRGSETPYQRHDYVIDQMIAEEKWRIPKVYARTVFLRDKSHARYIRHNQRIRKLEDKITGGVYGVHSFKNKF